MKYITILILSLAFTVNAAKYKIAVANYDRQSIDSTLIVMLGELKYFLDEPLNWCDVYPIDEFSIVEQGSIYSKVSIKMQADCDESIVRRKFKEFWVKYDKFLYEHGDRVDELLENIYPDYKLYWGMAMNSYNFIQLKIQPNFGATGSTYEKVLFFRLKMNNEYLTDPMRLEMPGSLLNTIPTNTIPDRFTRSAQYVFVIPTKLLKSDELSIDVQRQWHLVSNETFIKSSY
jgi:hypothetical protein